MKSRLIFKSRDYNTKLKLQDHDTDLRSYDYHVTIIL